MRARIASFYFALFASVGITLPYLPPYWRSLGLDGKEIAFIGSIAPFLTIFVPPIWGWIADRSRRPALLLRVAAAGTALAFLPVLLVRAFPAIAAVMLVTALFSTTLSSLADSVAVPEARRLGTEYARLRLWGSVGFVVTTYAFGAWLDRGGRAYDAVVAGAALLATTALAAHFVPDVAPAPGPPPSLADAGRLASRPALLAFLGAGLFHWAAASPFHLFFAVHLRDLGVSPTWTGAGLAAAVTAEVAMMWAFRRLAARVRLFPILALAFGVTAARWWLVSVLASGPAFAVVQILHGLTFGAFFVASIAHLERSVPEALRATGRALYASVVFGLGGVLGNVVAGTLYDLGGGRLAFYGGALVELGAPALLALAAVLDRRGVDPRSPRG
jgi:PPP family 3-phenylpropionic acid transporter